MKYVNLVISNNSDNTDRFYTYACEYDNVQIGQKVYVPFNKGNRRKEAYVFQIMDTLPEEIKGLKYVDSIDEQVCLTDEIVDLCIWMKKRYVCRYIDAVNCFTPTGSISKRGKKRNPYRNAEGEKQETPELTDEQRLALDKIIPVIKTRRHKIFLLHGVTGSGKTEIYMRMIAECLAKGRAAIMLVPEIALTKQIIERFIGRFGADGIAVLHSKLSLGERYDEWARIRSGDVKIVIGARSAVFAPLTNIGVIILDEEHEPTYKSDKTPKYDTVEVAIKRVKSQRNKGIVVLGSATPSVVSCNRAAKGIYDYIALKKRYNEVALPFVEIVDMRRELRQGNKSIFSTDLHHAMDACLESGQQVILFLNRRGYAAFISCRDCGYVVKCQDCSISLTYHKSNDLAICHYCGHKETVPYTCPDCGSKYIRQFGAGTEKVEEEAQTLFPKYEIGRFDLDTIKKKGDIERTLNDFRRGKTRILIGTQLVAKGLDFANVGLVGIISADTTLNIPDFRSAERTFQLITQAAGRAGRGDTVGHVIIQSYTPEHYAITAAERHDYEGFYKTEIAMRKCMNYPPYVDLIQVVLTAEEQDDADGGAMRVFEALVESLPKETSNIFSPQPLHFFKQSGARAAILIKCPRGKRNLYMEVLAEIRRQIAQDKKCKYSIGIDINPYSFL